MTRYALLILPSTNRVYAEASVALTVAELRAFDATVLGDRLSEPVESTIAGVPYVLFEADLTVDDVAYLSNLSSIYALFEVEGELLRPVPLTRLDRYDDDLITIQKYAGKTNEQFTKLLLNVTVLASASARGLARGRAAKRLSVLDPLCGRGTTLNQALMYGFDAAGIDLDAKDYEVYTTFMQTWLKRKRIKHQVESGPVRRNRQVVARRTRIRLAADRDDYKAGDTQTLDVVCVDTTRAGEFFRPSTFDVMVTDLPYGVQHGSKTGKALARGPLDLLTAAGPAWAALLRPGAAIGMSWNTHVARRDAAAKVLLDCGLDVLDGPPFDAFGHRVDQAIARDIIVARKPLP